MSTDEIIALGYGVSWLVSWPFFTRYAWDTGHGLSNDRDRMDTVLVGGGEYADEIVDTFLRVTAPASPTKGGESDGKH